MKPSGGVACPPWRQAVQRRSARCIAAALTTQFLIAALWLPAAHAQDAGSSEGGPVQPGAANSAPNPDNASTANPPDVFGGTGPLGTPGQVSNTGQFGASNPFGAFGHSAFYGQATGNSLDAVFGDTVMHDTNLFRLPRQFGPQMDTVNSSYAGLRVNKLWARQTFQFNITQTNNRFERFSYLNNSALDYHALWLWTLTSHLKGTLHEDYNQALAPFEGGTTTQRDVSVNRSRGLTMDGLLFGGWHALFNETQNYQVSDQSQQAAPDFRTNTAEAALNYVMKSNSSLTATRRLTTGEYVGLAPQFTGAALHGNGFHRVEYELKATLILSPRSTLSPRISWLTHKQQNSQLYDFSGPQADITYNWIVTDKLSLLAEVQHTLYAFTDPVYNRQFGQFVKIAPQWQVGPKTSAHITLQGTRYTYGTLSGATPTGPARSETVASAEVGMSWLPLGYLTLAASFNHSQRTVMGSNLFPFLDTMARLTASVTF